MATAAAVVGEPCPRTPATFELQHLKASVKDGQSPAGGKQECSSPGRGGPGRWRCIAPDNLGALGIQHRITASAGVSQGTAARTAAPGQRVSAFTFSIAAPPKTTRGQAEN